MVALRVRRRAGRALAALLVGASLIVVPGCRSVGRVTNETFNWGARVMTPNPVAVVPYYAGLAVGFLAGLPLCLFSWPLTQLLYPADEDEYSLSADLAPAILFGTAFGTLFGAPAYPLGLPLVPGGPQ